jgi:inorganic pyrophosphatase
MRLLLFSSLMFVFSSCSDVQRKGSAPEAQAASSATSAEMMEGVRFSPYRDELSTDVRITGHDFLRDFPARTPDGLVNVIVEIPAGTNAKWEVEKDTGHLAWEPIQDSLRVVRFLPYPANYGMIPRTYLPVDQGGDGDPLDVFVVGPARSRGSVMAVRVVGVIRMQDRGQQDDKLIAVDTDSWFRGVYTLNDLRSQYPGVDALLTDWLAAYKGPGFVVIEGIDNEVSAEAILEASILAFDNQ